MLSLLYITLYNLFSILNFADKIIKCNHSTKRYWSVLFISSKRVFTQTSKKFRKSLEY